MFNFSLDQIIVEDHITISRNFYFLIDRCNFSTTFETARTILYVLVTIGPLYLIMEHRVARKKLLED